MATSAPGRTEPSYTSWAEGFMYYERRSNLPSSNGEFDRKQETYGGLAGIEYERSARNATWLFGGFGGYSRTEQDFGSQSSQDATSVARFDYQFSGPVRDLLDPTPFDPFDPPLGPSGTGYPPGTSQQSLRDLAINSGMLVDEGADPQDPTNQRLFRRFLDVSVPQALLGVVTTTTTQSLSGASLGLYGSYKKNGYFFDVVSRIDFIRLERTTTQQAPVYSLNLSTNSVATATGCLGFDGNGNDPDGALDDGVDLSNLITAAPGERTTDVKRSDLTSYTLAFTTGYRVQENGDWWWEPSAGVSYNYANFDGNEVVLGLEDGHSVRLRGGVTIGKSHLVRKDGGNVLWNVSLGNFLYSDVLIEGYVRNGGGFSPLAVEADEGKIRYEGILRNELDFLNGSLLYTEVAGRVGEDLWGVGGKAGFKVRW